MNLDYFRAIQGPRGRFVLQDISARRRKDVEDSIFQIAWNEI